MNLPHPQHHPLQPFRITPRTLFQTVPDYRRRSYPESAADVERMNKHASRRASHNIVEKRYRVNLNSKFRQLEDVVDRGKNSRAGGSTSMATSTAATATATATATGTSSRRQQSPKAAILDGALTYIAALEKENRALREKLEGKEDKNENETENGLDGGPCGGTDPDSDPGTQKDDPQRLLVYSPGEILPLRPSCAHNIGVNVKREGRSP
ncbi:hypothetical protein BJX61DRAFT_496436 [Aspergillus egyptiacus]|nr:hypothetical protein BJX61DRAFT_496436 [Aspergillus egyptiacus]